MASTWIIGSRLLQSILDILLEFEKKNVSNLHFLLLAKSWISLFSSQKEPQSDFNFFTVITVHIMFENSLKGLIRLFKAQKWIFGGKIQIYFLCKCYCFSKLGSIYGHPKKYFGNLDTLKNILGFLYILNKYFRIFGHPKTLYQIFVHPKIFLGDFWDTLKNIFWDFWTP